jgi:hypothetical protein
MITYKQANTAKEIQQIIALQQRNLPKNLSQQEMEEQGFLTIEHTYELVLKMNMAFPHTLAKDGENVVGYALSMHPQFGNEIELLRAMFKKTETLVPNNLKCLVMGQICVAKPHRGLGIFRGLYKNMQRYTKDMFDVIITEVDVKNTRSMNSHKSVGFEELCRYSSVGRTWSFIMLKQ